MPRAKAKSKPKPAETPRKNSRDVVTIDGPAGSGKSTTAREVARRLGFIHLDTGALYRVLTFAALEEEISPADAKGLVELLDRIRIDLREEGGKQTVWLNGEPVTREIRMPEVTRATSPISRHGEVRERMVDLQRDFARSRPVVAEGRDMGTVIFPDARWKFYLDASLEERVRRRRMEMLESGYDIPEGELRLDMEERDRQDTTREIAPLRCAEDAVKIDTTDRSPEEVVEEIISVVKKERSLRP